MEDRIRAGVLGVVVLIFVISGELAAQIPRWEKQLETDPTNSELLLKLARAYHDRGGKKQEEEAVKRAEQYLTKLLAIESQNALAMVYYGSVLTMKARDTLFPWKKKKYMEQGFASMDQAVMLAPDEPEIRLIRAINSTSVPKMFKRLKIALADFQHIAGLDKEKLTKLTNKFWLPYYFYHGVALKKNNQRQAAREKFVKVIELDSKAKLAEEAGKYLEKMN